MFMELRKITEDEYNTVANEIKEEYITNQENKNNSRNCCCWFKRF